MRTLPTLLATGLLLCALTACGSDDPEPKLADPTPSQTVTSASEAPITDPSTSEADPASGSAEAFLRAWQAEGIAMQNTGDTAAYRAMSKGCDSCNNLADRVDSIYAAGGSITIGQSEILDLARVGKKQDVEVFEYTLRSPKTTLQESSTSSVTSLPGGDARYQVNVAMTDKGFFVSSATAL